MKAPLVIPPGIVSDDTTFASSGRWADGNNMRPWRGSMQTVGGWNLLTSGLSGVCRNVLPWTDNSGYQNLAFGTHTKLYIYLNGTLTDITPSGLASGSEHGAGGPGWSAGGYGSGGYGGSSPTDYFPRTWSLSTWGQYLLASPRNGTIYVWQNNTASLATVIGNAPDNISFMLVTPERQVIAFGCNEETSGTFNPLCIRGCDLENYDDWTTTDANNAFEHILEGGGRIVGAALVGGYVMVWTDNSLYQGQFIGAAGQAYRFDRIASNCGLIGPNAVEVINQTAFWVTPDYQFYTWTPGAPPQLQPCPIRNDFKDNIAAGQFEKICSSSVGQYGEVWWFYPDNRDGLENSRYVGLSTIDGQWFRGQIARSACVDAGPTQFPLFVTPDGTAYWHENGQTADGAVLECSLTTADQYINNAGNYVTLRGMWPDFEAQQGPVSLSLSLRKYPQASTVYEKGPYSLTVNKEKKDFMASGRVVSATFSMSSSPAFMRMGKPTFDMVPAGQQ